MQSPSTVATERYYLRCRDCLVISVVDCHRFPPRSYCGLCKGKVITVGRVAGSRIVRDEERTPCDDRCTLARGPNCECGCYGENHGSRRLVTYTIDVGKVPTVTPAMDAERHLQDLAAFRSDYDAARAKILETYPEIEAKRAGRWVASFERLRDGQILMERLAWTGSMKSHRGRMKRITETVDALARKGGAV